MLVDDRSSKFCIVGAGSSGLAAAKALSDAKIPFDCLEREDDVGGNWYFGKPNSRVYASTHTISSKRLTEYVDYPMPDDFPQYPHHRQVWEYLRGYARRFGLYDRIEFGRAIERIEVQGSGCGVEERNPEPRTSNPERRRWTVRLADGATRVYRGVIIANGHNWDPRLPQFPGSFTGTTLHSAEYKNPELFAGKRVLVVGAGNTGCDIAAEAAQVAARTVLSVRRGYHFLPKFWRGKPIDVLNERLLRWRVPLTIRRGLANYIQLLAFRRSRRLLPRPDHKLFESHPIINSRLHEELAKGRITVRPDVAELCGDEVRFVDAPSPQPSPNGRGGTNTCAFATREPFDVIVFATGYNITFPFIDRELLNWRDGKPRLFLNVFHPTDDGLFVVGLIQPDSGQFGLVDYQSKLVAKFIAACDTESPFATQLRDLKQNDDADLSGGVRYLSSPRHLLEVEHFSYRERLKELLEFRL